MALLPRLCLLERGGKPEQQGLVAVTSDELHADAQPITVLLQRGRQPAIRELGTPLPLDISQGAVEKSREAANKAKGSVIPRGRGGFCRFDPRCRL